MVEPLRNYKVRQEADNLELRGVATGDPRIAWIYKHLRFGKFLASRFSGVGFDKDDLVGLANLAIVGVAERKFNGTFPEGVADTTIISRKFIELVRENGLAGRSYRNRQSYERQLEKLAQELEHEPTDREMEKAFGLNAEQLVFRQRLQPPQSLEELLVGESDATLGGKLVDEKQELTEDQVMAAEITSELNQAISTLPLREKYLIIRYYRDGKRWSELGEKLNLSPSRISQLRARALRLLRKELEGKDLI